MSKIKEIMLLADMIKSEINRMCVTHDLSELDTMALHAKKNIEKLQNMRYSDLAEEVREEADTIEQKLDAEDEKSNLFEIHKGLEKINTAQKELQENYENELRVLRAQKKELKTKLQYEINEINSNRIDNAKRFIYIEGLKNFGVGETRLCVDEFISDLVNDNYKILKEYYGCKDYDRFSCQQSNHRYGFGPAHGNIVFSIRATQDFREGMITPNEKDKNDILYMLENVKNHKIKE